jgi:ElaB/YqjD/DUF883 family membrane-anchored ribosome-binding protein
VSETEPLTNDEKQAIVDALMAIGEAFLPERDDADIRERREQFAELRRALPGAAIDDAALIRGLWGGVRLFADGLHGALAIARDSNEMAGELVDELERVFDELERVFDELERVFNARTRANVERATRLREQAVQLRESGEKIESIARALHRTDRWVYAALPEHLKRRR